MIIYTKSYALIINEMFTKNLVLVRREMFRKRALKWFTGKKVSI